MDAQMHALRPGDGARVIGFNAGDRGYRQRLLAMGMTRGAAFTVTRVAPFGDPIEVSLRGFRLTLRRAEAAILRVERI